ncbi:hypothetical protein N665_4555s0003 [Sinapis alba]|nr:hypothetical protein N665_4555s0003 [Sinapis alba]
MLQLKDQFHDYLRCNIGDGTTILFWYDYWTELNPFFNMFGAFGPRSLRIPLNATVSQALTRNRNWNIPPARSELAKTLQVILSSLEVPRADKSSDVYLWKHHTGGFRASFSSRVTWEFLRIPYPIVSWHTIVWFKEEIPRCSFITWTAFLQRLPTRDRLISWGLTLPPSCVLCNSANESHEHLFFNSPFAIATWNCFCGRYMVFRPTSLDSLGALCRRMHSPHAQRGIVILKLLSQIIVYSLWRERNAHIFRDKSMTQEAFSRTIDHTIRDRLLAPSLVSSSFPSLFQLYFWFFSPFS